jgi:AcrR family transcriptional regulator
VSTGNRRATRRQARVEAILNAAMGILLTEGTDALTMRRLAKAVGLTPGAAYRYFPSKDDILAHLGQRTLSRYTESLHAREMAARAEGRSLPPEAAALYVLLSRTWHYFQLSVNDAAGWRLINLFLVDPRRLIDNNAHASFMAMVAAQLQHVAAITQEAVAVNALHPGPSMDRALAILATLNGHLQYLKLANTSHLGFTPHQTLRFGLEGLLMGWGADSALLQLTWTHLAQHAALLPPSDPRPAER